MIPLSTQQLINLFQKTLSGVGPRQATRFVFSLIKKPKGEIETLGKLIQELPLKVKFCQSCSRLIENQNQCDICLDKSRNKSLLMTVEKEIDLEAIENTKSYSGLYFILGGTISPLDGSGVPSSHLKKLYQRIKENPEIKEVILAMNPTVEGENTSLYLQKILKELPVKITTLGRGLSIGSEIEYVDELTLKNAFLNRK